MKQYLRRRTVEHHDAATDSNCNIDAREDWGNVMERKHENCFRIAFQNINGYSRSAGQKDYSLYNFIYENHIDIMGVQK